MFKVFCFRRINSRSVWCVATSRARLIRVLIVVALCDVGRLCSNTKDAFYFAYF